MILIKLIFKNSVFSSVILVFLTALFVMVAIAPTSKIQHVFGQVMKQGQELQRLDVIVEKDDFTNELRNKLLRIPGVVKVSIISPVDIQKRMASLNSNIGLELDKLSESFTFSGLSVQFALDFPRKSIELIQDYIQKLSGQRKLVMKLNNNANKLTAPLELMTRNIHYIVIGTLLFFWLATFSIWSKNLDQIQYLVQNLHRRKSVVWKVHSFMLVIPFILSVISTYYYFGTINWLVLAVIALILLLALFFKTSRKQLWNS
jgi:hypothetical protein